jgi:Domain of unknown function (DUF6915)
MASMTAGRDWAESLAVHEFLDLSKAACADRRHRFMLHHVDLGGDLAALAFPAGTDVAGLVRSHVEEDLGRAATLADWLDGMNRGGLPRPVRRRIGGGPGGVSRLVAARLHPAQAADVERVADLLFRPCAFYPEDPAAALSVLMNCMGPPLVRRLFGEPRIATLDGRRVVTDWGWIAEALIMACFGRIPDLAEVARCVIDEPVRARPRRRVA